VCEECNYDPREDAQIQSIEDEFHKLRVMRGVIHGDHQIRKSDGGSDAADNIRTLCCRCHMIKTYKEKDYLAGKAPLEGKDD
jgi:5-methylcytosine-specific restriction endonuclease McrA